MKRVKRIITLSALLIFFGSIFLFILNEVHDSTGKATGEVSFTVEKGEGLFDIAEKLKKEGLISNTYYFIYYVWSNDYSEKLIAGEYALSSELKIPEIVQILIKGQTKPGYVKVTFPEGWTAMEMAERLNDKNFSGDEFLEIVQKPSEDIISSYAFFQGRPDGASLEGYLFPDTYFFSPDASAENIVMKMLDNFDVRFSKETRDKILTQEKNFFEVLTMASIIESEVSSEKDRGLVSGLFWNRLEIGMALQSDATVSYALGGEKKIQHNASDIQVDSPYNTYKFPGLPPGPVSNPGISSINASINPVDSEYIYFLNNPKTGETFFSETFEQHVRNKAANGL